MKNEDDDNLLFIPNIDEGLAER